MIVCNGFVYVGNFDGSGMSKRAKELSAIEVKRMNQPGFHAVGGVSGLHLRINDGEGKSWILRTLVKGKRRDIGLGGFPDVPLVEARNLARESKESIRAGADPVEERIAARRRAKVEILQGLTFSEAVNDYLGSNKLDGLTNDKHRAQWGSTLRTYAIPHIGHMRLSDITAIDVKAALDPIWAEKHETATRVRMRIETVLTWATVAGHRNGENPARWKGNLSEMLPKFKTTEVQTNHPALPIDLVATWHAALSVREGIAAKALSFLTFCAARSGEVREAMWSEIDLNQKLWTVPAARMKAKKEHRVPLSAAAVALLTDMPRFSDSPYVFPSPRGKAMSDMTLSAVMKRMHTDEIQAGRPGWLDPRLDRPAVPHGLRSTFKDWVSERTDYASDMAEIALAHKVGNAVEQAYRRGDMIEKRRVMMEAWARFITN